MIDGKPPLVFFSKFFYTLLIFCYSYDCYLNHLNDHDDGHNNGHNNHPPTVSTNSKPLNTLKQRYQQQQQRLETRRVQRYIFYLLFITLVIILAIYEWKLGVNEGLRRIASRALRYVFFLHIFYYTNQYLKVLYLRMQTSGMAGKEDGNKWGARDKSSQVQVHFFLSFSIQYYDFVCIKGQFYDGSPVFRP